MSMEIDPNTGYMWVIDTGRRETSTPNPVNACPAKILILDLQTNQVRGENFFHKLLIFNQRLIASKSKCMIPSDFRCVRISRRCGE